MTHEESIRVLELLGFKDRCGTYQSYQNVPFVGQVIMLCMDMHHKEKRISVYLMKWHQQVLEQNRNRVRKHMERWNKKQMDKARAEFPELDSLAEVAHTLEVCP